MRPLHTQPFPRFHGEVFHDAPGKRLHTRRGGGKRAQEQDEGDASVPTPRPHHSRPYECDDLPPKSLPLKAGVGMMRGGDACVALVLLP